MDTGVESDGVLLHNNLLLDQRVYLLFQEVTLVDVVGLELLEIFLQVGDVLYDLFQDVIRRLRRMVLQSCALWSKELNFLLVIVEKLDGVFRVPLQQHIIKETVKSEDDA